MSDATPEQPRWEEEPTETRAHPQDLQDPLLAALRALPSRASIVRDGPAETRLQRQARAAYLRNFESSPWRFAATDIIGRAAVPVFLAGIVGVYMMWAVAAATAIVH